MKKNAMCMTFYMIRHYMTVVASCFFGVCESCPTSKCIRLFSFINKEQVYTTTNFLKLELILMLIVIGEEIFQRDTNYFVLSQRSNQFWY